MKDKVNNFIEKQDPAQNNGMTFHLNSSAEKELETSSSGTQSSTEDIKMVIKDKMKNNLKSAIHKKKFQPEIIIEKPVEEQIEKSTTSVS